MTTFRMTFSNATRKRAFKCDKAHTQRSDKQWGGTGKANFFMPSQTYILPATGLIRAMAREPGKVTRPDTVAKNPEASEHKAAGIQSYFLL